MPLRSRLTPSARLRTAHRLTPAAGTNRIIRESAALAPHSDDVPEVLSSFPSRHVHAPQMPDYEEQDEDIPEPQYDALLMALTPVSAYPFLKWTLPPIYLRGIARPS